MKEEKNLFRMNFIIQDSSAMTLETNLVKIIEAVLFDAYGERLTKTQIADRIKQDFELDFSDDEIQLAIKKKGKNIQHIEHCYFLKPEFRENIGKQEDFNAKILRLVKQAIAELKLEVSEIDLADLLKEYIYYCFNSNKNALLALINNTKQEYIKFNRNETDIKLINIFLSWENEEKNKFIYDIISYGYIYCSLTVKKNELLANRLFSGKNFILDANIIFRLAGINKDERINTIKSFVKKCKEVGVSLCYTTATLDEINRVIVNKVKWIESVTGNQQPLDLQKFDFSENDFYNIYFDWASRQENVHNDYKGFQNYLTKLVLSVLDEITSVVTPNYMIKREKEFEAYADSLNKYKIEHSKKKQTKASLTTDVNNFMYLRSLRKGNSNKNIWTTNDFLISADQNLIGWSLEVENGIPVVVFPSVWLTIMLRFSGRTTDDYKAFCSFLEMKTHHSDDNINVYHLLESLSEKITNNELKELIVKEVFDHKEDYLDYIDDDLDNYTEITDKAFDKIMQEKELVELKKYESLKSEYEEKSKELDNYELQKIADDEFKIVRLVDYDIHKHFRIIRFINKIKKVVGFVIFLFMCLLTIMAINRKGPLLLFMNSYAPEAVNNMGNILSALGLFWAIIVIIAGFISAFLSFLCSEKQVQRYKNRRTIFYKNLFC